MAKKRFFKKTYKPYMSLVVCGMVALGTLLANPKEVKAYSSPGDNSIKLDTWNMENGTSKSTSWSGTINTYQPTKTTDKIVTGDFDGDGHDEVAAFYDYGNGDTGLHVWNPNSSGDTFKWTSVWKSNDFDAKLIDGRVVAGDFDGDGKDEIAALYDYGNNKVGLFIWNATSDTSYNCSKQWESGVFDASKIVGMVSGNYDEEGKDEIGIVYDYGNRTTGVWILDENPDKSFKANKSWESTTFDAQKVKGRIVSGDYSGDSKDEIAMFYDYDNRTTKMWVLAQNSKGTFDTSKGWESTTFDADLITDKVTSTNDNSTTKDKIGALYDYSSNASRMFVWNPTGDSFTCSNVWESKSYDADRTVGRVFAGKFDGNTSKLGVIYDGTAEVVQSKESKLISESKKYIGIPYVYGGTTTAGFDCSGFVQYVYSQMGIQLNRTTFDQINQGTPVSQSELKPGDLIFTENGGHVGIYVGNGQMIHAPRTGDVVRITDIYHYYSARRIIN
ncbi:NlpC/P60 family protein [Clostridium sp. YIM B02551]|uniref:NlpC/P60 family protein n=1 Tax=Clostridium sp. YIM B02551 TaxID=2910679 RepID=UPI001EEC788C|nr:NlpC/P60 family protein [Clostridium sp. YIM B02551]